MDLNELLHAHQVAVMRASKAGDEASRENHFDQVALYAERIRELRELRRAADRPPTRAESATIICGTYAGAPAAPVKPAILSFWEGEGGALDPSAAGVRTT